MKRILLTCLAISLISMCGIAQSGQKWSVNGNNVNNGNYLGTNNNQPLILKTNGQEQFRIDNNGNIGIGTPNTLERLSVNGNILATGSISGESLNVVDFVKSEKGLRIANVLCIEGSATGAVQNGICSETSDLMINSKAQYGFNTILNGNNTGMIGIGTLSPSHKLDVVGNTKLGGDAIVGGDFTLVDLADPSATEDRLLVIDKDGLTRDLELTELVDVVYDPPTPCKTDINGNSIPIWKSVAGQPGIIYTGDPCDAFVGIGISNPQYRLVVDGNAHVQESMMIGVNPDPTNATLSVLQSPGQSGPIFLLGTSTGSNVEKKFMVMNDGLVYSTEVRVRLSQDFPDYVFESDYSLMPLHELESYIATKGHLPNMPTATTVEREGMSLGEMQRLTVEKVEELTLYVLRLNRENELLKAKLADIEKQLHAQSK